VEPERRGGLNVRLEAEREQVRVVLKKEVSFQPAFIS
jgi:hypothetical protein